jgi:hypothetical protein
MDGWIFLHLLSPDRTPLSKNAARHVVCAHVVKYVVSVIPWVSPRVSAHFLPAAAAASAAFFASAGNGVSKLWVFRSQAGSAGVESGDGSVHTGCLLLAHLLRGELLRLSQLAAAHAVALLL